MSTRKNTLVSHENFKASPVADYKPFVDYVPAQVSDKQICRIYYYARNPDSGRLERVVVKCNRIKQKSLRLRYARTIADNINRRLREGWNPFVERKTRGNYTTMEELIDGFLKEKGREVRADTMRSYSSMANHFLEWCKCENIEKSYCCLFDEVHARRYMHSVETGGVQNTTYNSYLRFQHTLMLWAMERGLTQYDAFERIKKKREERKHRETIPPALLKEIKEYLIQSGQKEFWVVCLLCYRMFIRPKEIMMLKVGMVNFREWLLEIPSDVAKNHNARTVAIPDKLKPFFASLATLPTSIYIFSDGYKPGRKLLSSRDVGNTWVKIRSALGFAKCYSFYSLKDTGITEMLERGVPAKLVKELADHHSLEMTERYTHKSNARAILSYDDQLGFID